MANCRPAALHVANSTVGVVFLGTPHRGTASTKWGEMIALTGKLLGLGSENSILKDLREDSETLNDLLHEFTLWLFRNSVPTVCFFEQHETDCGARFSIRWKELVSIIAYTRDHSAQGLRSSVKEAPV